MATLWQRVTASDLDDHARRYHQAMLVACAACLSGAICGAAELSVLMVPFLTFCLASEIRSAEWWRKAAGLRLEDIDREIEEER